MVSCVENAPGIPRDADGEDLDLRRDMEVWAFHRQMPSAKCCQSAFLTILFSLWSWKD